MSPQPRPKAVKQKESLFVVEILAPLETKSSRIGCAWSFPFHIDGVFGGSGFLGLGQQLVAPSLQQICNLACHVAVDRVGHREDVGLRLL